MSTGFQAFIEELLRRENYHGKKSRLAADIELTQSAFWRQVVEKGTLGLEACLRLAKVSGEPPRKVLDLAGKSSAADVIEELYGKPRAPLSDVDRRLLVQPEAVKRRLVALIASLNDAEKKPPALEQRSVKGRRAGSA